MKIGKINNVRNTICFSKIEVGNAFFHDGEVCLKTSIREYVNLKTGGHGALQDAKEVGLIDYVFNYWFI